MRLIAIALLLAACGVSGIAAAQEPPGRVGRLAYVDGNVALYQDPEIGWDATSVNAPITSENSLWTEPGSRAEMRVSGTAVRLAEATQVDIARLDDASLDAFVVQGSVAIGVRWLDEGQVLDFSSPRGRFHLQGAGRYRIDVDPSRDETLLTVFTGRASFSASQGEVRVEAGSALRIHGGPNPSFEREPASHAALDRWAEERDGDGSETASTRYVSPSMTGYEELDRYGQWVDEPGYGALWSPTNVDADWLPYREGHWAWVRPWGWTWVGQEPWGYAPYHYGRWVYARDRWCWSPGQRVDHPVWAPALVAWIGGANFSVSLQAGAAPAVGWYPLAPWERYQPWYHASDRYVTRLNVAVRSEPPREWRDRYARDARAADWHTFNRDRAATVVRRDALGDRRDVRRDMLTVNRDAVRRASVVSPATVAPREDYVRRRNEAHRDNPSQRAGPPASQPGRPQGVAPTPPASANAVPANPAARPAQQGQRAPSAQPPVPQAQRAPSPQPPAPAAANPAARPSEAERARLEQQHEQQQRQQAHEQPQRERPQPAAPKPAAPQPAAPQPVPPPAAANPAARATEAERARLEHRPQSQEAQRPPKESAQKPEPQRPPKESAQKPEPQRPPKESAQKPELQAQPRAAAPQPAPSQPKPSQPAPQPAREDHGKAHEEHGKPHDENADRSK